FDCRRHYSNRCRRTDNSKRACSWINCAHPHVPEFVAPIGNRRKVAVASRSGTRRSGVTFSDAQSSIRQHPSNVHSAFYFEGKDARGCVFFPRKRLGTGPNVTNRRGARAAPRTNYIGSKGASLNTRVERGRTDGYCARNAIMGSTLVARSAG